MLAAHPDLGRSHATRTLLDALRASPVADRVELRDLYRLYPDFHIHIEAEQRTLEAARLVVMLHPIYWYSMPALQKLWLDDVAHLGWAYGPGGTALHGKDLWLVASTGGGAEAYAPGGHNHHAIEEFLLPYRGGSGAPTRRLAERGWTTPQLHRRAPSRATRAWPGASTATGCRCTGAPCPMPASQCSGAGASTRCRAWQCSRATSTASSSVPASAPR